MKLFSIYIKSGYVTERIDFEVIQSNVDLTLIRTSHSDVWITTPDKLSLNLHINAVNKFVESTLTDISSRYPVKFIGHGATELICRVEYQVMKKSDKTELIEINGLLTRAKPLVSVNKQRAIGRACKLGEPGFWFVNRHYARQRLLDAQESLNEVSWAGEAAFRLQFNEALERLENKQL